MSILSAGHVVADPEGAESLSLQPLATERQWTNLQRRSNRVSDSKLQRPQDLSSEQFQCSPTVRAKVYRLERSCKNRARKLMHGTTEDEASAREFMMENME